MATRARRPDHLTGRPATNTTSNDQPLLDHTALTTGATAGIGYETARALARGGARVIITGRDPNTGERAAAAIRDEARSGPVTFLRADHSTVGGNQDVADRARATVPRLARVTKVV